ncbi:4Fe-4S ferredoxin [Methanoculleus bourgensis MS2]|uniref:4Fe-4S ferredoxin n=1 Tax=Methanoculleus bourgensis (strain ATCC 43281 / DSM 3045 / OCM 15 / MS2) TaxID=1201294 RepID=I7KD57_METBM|nr:4Fe-4S ferredoxin [Methanoculleus bourgensis MS2]
MTLWRCRRRKSFCDDNNNINTMLRINRDKCGYCGTCVAVCPEDALELIDAYLSLERECIACGICARACPLGALEVVHEE